MRALSLYLTSNMCEMERGSVLNEVTKLAGGDPDAGESVCMDAVHEFIGLMGTVNVFR